MIIRPIAHHEVERLVEPGRKFCEEAGLPPLNPGSFVPFFRAVIQQDIGVIFELETAAGPVSWMGGFIMQDPFSGDTVAMESFWFSSPESRGRGMILLKTFEEWAHNSGAARIIMVHLEALNADRLAKIYERRGYKKLESHYLKEL